MHEQNCQVVSQYFFITREVPSSVYGVYSSQYTILFSQDVLHFFLRCPGSPGRWCHTRLRPRTHEFLELASKNYELHVCTFGARQYAHAIAELLDPEKKYFSHRILSRDECFDVRTKAANLK